MRRVLVMGPPGSGKSTLARALGVKLGLPVFHLDQSFHNPGWSPVSTELFVARVADIAALPAWVIDGNYPQTIALRLQTADTIVFLESAGWKSVQRIIWRTIAHRGRVRPNGPEGCLERLDAEFLQYVWNWNRKQREAVMHGIGGFAGKKIFLSGIRQHRIFLKTALAD